MSFFMQFGDAFKPTASRDSIYDTLPVGNYLVAASMTGMFFQRTGKFDLPEKMYGNIEARAERILNTFLERPRSTGVLLAGEKGSGKSQLARLISLKGYAQGIPTIIVNAPFVGDEFNSLLASIEQPAIVLMDEFEKVYGREEQEAILTLLDGNVTSKKLFVLTVNDKYRIDAHMRNRPGRLFYHLDFAGLESDFVREYCTDNLLDKSHIEAVVKVGTMFEAFNFDMLKALVEEMNRYGEDPFDALEWLNAKPVGAEDKVRYDVQVFDAEGKALKVSSPVSENPLHSPRGMHLCVTTKATDEDGEEYDDDEYLYLKAADIRRLDAEAGKYEFESEQGHKCLFTKQAVSSYTIRDLAY